MALADYDEPGRSAPHYKYPADPWRLDALWIQVTLV